MDDSSREPDQPNIRIREEVTPAEVAAVVTAATSTREDTMSGHTPPWLRAALREGLGERPPAEPSDLR